MAGHIDERVDVTIAGIDLGLAVAVDGYISSGHLFGSFLLSVIDDHTLVAGATENSNFVRVNRCDTREQARREFRDKYFLPGLLILIL